MEVSKLWTRKTRIVSQDRRFKMLRVFMKDPPPAFRKGFFFRIRDTLFPPHALLHFKSPKKPHNLAKSSGASTVSPQKKKSPSQSTKQHHRFTCRQSSASPNLGHVHRKKKRTWKIQTPYPASSLGDCEKRLLRLPGMNFSGIGCDGVLMNGKEYRQVGESPSDGDWSNPSKSIPSRKESKMFSSLFCEAHSAVRSWGGRYFCYVCLKVTFYKRCTLLCQKGKILSQKKEKAQKKIKK